MKLVTLALIAAFAVGVAAQNNTAPKTPETHIPGITVMPPGPIVNIGDMNLQIGCPVVFTDVVLNRNARYLPVKQDSAPDSSLEFKYKNQSGKQIESIEVHVALKVKLNKYDLDATTVTRDMTLTGGSGEVLPLNVFAYGVVRVTLEQVNYVGGKTWTPDNSMCNYQKLSGIQQAAK